METVYAAACLEALANPARLQIYRILVRAGPDGMAAGQVQVRSGMAASTLSHHLGVLARAGVIRRRRQGTSIFCSADYAVMRRLIGFLQDECCADAGPPA